MWWSLSGNYKQQVPWQIGRWETRQEMAESTGTFVGTLAAKKAHAHCFFQLHDGHREELFASWVMPEETPYRAGSGPHIPPQIRVLVNPDADP